jgi:hypothetical protein
MRHFLFWINVPMTSRKIRIVTAMLAGLTDISNVCVVAQYEDPKISASNNVTVVIFHVRGKKRACQY